jgi:hypothetical protein
MLTSYSHYRAIDRVVLVFGDALKLTASADLAAKRSRNVAMGIGNCLAGIGIHPIGFGVSGGLAQLI